MIQSIYIKNFVFIDEVDVSFNSSLNIITGDSGVGKSIIFHALSLLFSKSSKGLIRRKNNEETIISIKLLIPSSSVENHKKPIIIFKDQRLEGEIIIKRIFERGSKNTILLNGSEICYSDLEYLRDKIFIICNQRQQLYFLSKKNHLSVLDTFARTTHISNELRNLWSSIQTLKRHNDELRLSLVKQKYNKDQLKEIIAEIELLNTSEDEEGEIVVKRRTLQEIDNSRHAIEKAISCLEGSGGAAVMIISASKHLAKLGDLCSQQIEIIDSCCLELQEIANDLKAKLFNSSNVEAQISQLDERLELLRDTAHRLGLLNPGMLLDAKKEAENLLIAWGEIEKKIIENELEIEKKTNAYITIADDLSIKRTSASKQMQDLVQDHLAELAMGNIEFMIKNERGKELVGGESGYDIITFVFRRKQGAVFIEVEIDKISGGELSRIVLSIYSVLSDNNGCSIIVFDEVDTGVGGHIAAAMGACLVKLAEKCQVIAITHSPQVAVYAAYHYRISGVMSEAGEYKIVVNLLDRENKIQEIARMISGKLVGAASREAAAQLLADVEKL